MKSVSYARQSGHSSEGTVSDGPMYIISTVVVVVLNVHAVTVEESGDRKVGFYGELERVYSVSSLCTT